MSNDKDPDIVLPKEREPKERKVIENVLHSARTGSSN
jgi:hypothetical protein